jgi:hypothetical protein
MAFKRSDWNAVIQAVNDKNDSLGHPVAYLQLVGPDHLWSTSDVIAVRAKLQALCTESNPVFTADTTKWTQAIVNELYDAITNCQRPPAPVEVLVTATARGYVSEATGHVFAGITVFHNDTVILHWYLYANQVGSFTSVRTTTRTTLPDDVFTYTIQQYTSDGSVSVSLSVEVLD